MGSITPSELELRRSIPSSQIDCLDAKYHCMKTFYRFYVNSITLVPAERCLAEETRITGPLNRGIRTTQNLQISLIREFFGGFIHLKLMDNTQTLYFCIRRTYLVAWDALTDNWLLTGLPTKLILLQRQNP